MTKTLFLGMLTVGSVVLVGCQPSTPATTEPATQPEEQSSEGRKLSEIASEILGGSAYECTLYDSETQMQMSYVLQGKKVSMNIQSQTEGGSMSRFVSDGETTHIWDLETKKGMKITVSQEAMQQFADDTPDAPELDNPEALAEIEEKYETMCKPTIVNPAEFAIPNDVEFQDMSQVLDVMQQFQPPQQ